MFQIHLITTKGIDFNNKKMTKGDKGIY